VFYTCVSCVVSRVFVLCASCVRHAYVCQVLCELARCIDSRHINDNGAHTAPILYPIVRSMRSAITTCQPETAQQLQFNNARTYKRHCDTSVQAPSPHLPSSSSHSSHSSLIPGALPPAEQHGLCVRVGRWYHTTRRKTREEAHDLLEWHNTVGLFSRVCAYMCVRVCACVRVYACA
jgi:hypothetical protein